MPMDLPLLTDLVDVPRVWDRLSAVERRLGEVTEASNPFLTEIAQHGLQAGGKRYRPLLTQVAAELGPNPGAEPVEAGVAVELVHLGSLYHDDVIDEASTRRGRVSVNANWTNTIAILSGDFLLARASEVAAPLGEEAVALIARTYASLVEGQTLELQLIDGVDHGPDEYYEVIGGKTASLIRTSARLGAMTGGAAPHQVEAVSEWGWEMGLVFQMTDDVLDLVADEAFLGKPAGSDMLEGTYTLPVFTPSTARPAPRSGTCSPRVDPIRRRWRGSSTSSAPAGPSTVCSTRRWTGPGWPRRRWQGPPPGSSSMSSPTSTVTCSTG